MLSINIEDVKTVLISCRPYLIFFAVVLAAVIALFIFSFVKKMAKHKKYMLRSQALIALLLALVTTFNMIALGPVSNLIDLASNREKVSKQANDVAQKLGVEVANEGIVLLENKDALLPITDTKNINIFGWASSNPCYGGSGSGGISDAYHKVSLYEGLENAGFKTNKELLDFYTEYNPTRPTVDMFTQDWTLPEPSIDKYSEELLANAKAFSDIAVVVLARTGCENADLPMDLSKVVYSNNSDAYDDFEGGRHYLELTKSEENLVDTVCSQFENVVIIYNGSSAFELGFVEKYPSIKGLVWCPGAGQTGFDGLGKILSGEINPSGKTTDTLVYDLTDTPTYHNFMITNYDNMDEHGVPFVNFGTGESVLKVPSFINYVEGIYVGYRFYETAAEEGFLNFEEKVQYPFGYGLSYTSFDEKMGDLVVDGENISVDITVTNTGDSAGKDVVELYYNPPYTNGGIEKSSVNLIDYAKTDILKPGESEVVTISFQAEDMASYDCLEKGCYVLEEGEYEISLREDSHTVIDAAKYTVTNTVVYNKDNPRSTDMVAATNQFDAAGDVVYLSRADHFANYATATAAPASASMKDEYKDKYLDFVTYDPENYNNASDVMPTTGAQNGIELAKLHGLDYDDPLWDSLLDELKIEEMNELIAMGGYQTVAVPSINKISTTDCDGPVDIYNNFTGVSSIGMPSIVMLAFTWNKDLAVKYGECLGQIASEMNVSGWYAPSMNMHRSAFAGRNFEYESEDGTLAGYVGASLVQGSAKYGVYAYIKHFALNDQETDRWFKNSVWCNEQAIREIYLKPFEISVKEGHAPAVMSSYNYIGTQWAGACSALLQKVLRDEWGFRGMVITDYFLAAGGAMDSDQAIRNGSDLMLTNMDAETNYLTDKTSATGVLAMRNACHNILYTVVNSRAYENGVPVVTKNLPWRQIMFAVDAILVLLLVVIEMKVIRRKYIAKRQ